MTLSLPVIIVFVVFILFDVALVIYILKKRKSGRFSEKQIVYIRSHWIRIIDMAKNNPNQAILDADKLLDHALGVMGYTGSVGEKLKKSGKLFKNLDAVWNAHKLRNRVAHDFTELSRDQVRVALNNFKNALRDLNLPL